MEKKVVVSYEAVPYVRESKKRVLTGFSELDYMLNGIEEGVTEIVGDTNTGKSIFTLGLIDSAVEQGYKVGVFAGEHTLSSFKNLIMRQHAKKNEFVKIPFVDVNGKATSIVDWYVNEECQKQVEEKFNDKLFLFDVRCEERDIGTIERFIKQCYKEEGVKFFVLDNLMEIDNNKDNQFQEQTAIITRIRNLAIRYHLYICLVMHTNKAGGNEGFRLTVKNAFGSSNITNKGYNVLFIYRKDLIETFNNNTKTLDRFKADCAKCGFDYDKCDAFLEVAKTKGVKNGIVGLNYNADNKKFEQAQKVSETEADKILQELTQRVQDDIFDEEYKGELPF